MRQQQLFSSFWVASTTAIVVTQPAWADTARLTAVQLNRTATGIEVILETPQSTSIPVFTSRSGETFIADIVNTKLRLPKGNAFRADNPANGITSVTVTPLNASSVRVTVTGSAGMPVGKVVQSDKGLILSLSTTSATSSTQTASHPAKKAQLHTSSITRRRAADKVSTNGRTNLSDQKTSRIAQSTRTSPPTVRLDSTNSDVLTQPTPAPRYLNPSPNPLQFPTMPEEVRIQGTQPITLEQAFELARRNNRTLQVAELTFERSRAALREAQAALLPTLNASVIVENLGNAFINGTSTGSSFSSGLSSLNTNANQPTSTNVNANQTATNNTTTGNQTGSTNTTTGNQTGSTNTTTGNQTGSTSAQTVNSVGNNTGTTGTGASTNGTGTAGTGTNSSGSTTGTGTSSGIANGVGNTTGNTSTNTSTVGRRSSTSIFNGALTLNYNLYTSGRRNASIRSAEEQVRYDRLGVELAAEQLRLDVSNDYYNLQGGDQQVLIYQAAVTNAQASLRDAVALERAGVGTRFDVLRSQVQLANSVQNLTLAQSQQQVYRRQLAQRLSVAQTIDLSAADPVQISGLWNLPLEESIILAFKNRAELEQFLALRNISEQNRRLALAAIGPQVSVGAMYNLNDTLTSSVSSSALGGSDQYTVQATASILLFDGGAARANAAQQEANKAIAETNFADTRNQIRFQVEQYFATLQSNLANIQTSTIALTQARESLRLARLRFQAGVGTQTDVISAENDLTNAEGTRITAILNYNRSLASLQRSVSSGQPR